MKFFNRFIHRCFLSGSILILLFCVVVMLPASLSASVEPTDSIQNLSQSQLKSFGKNAMRMGDIYSAIDYYSVYVSNDTVNYKMMFLLAELYRSSRNYPLAEQWYQKAYNGIPEKYPMALYHMAVMQKMQDNCESAVVNFAKFKKEGKGVKDARRLKKLMQSHVAGCDLIPNLMDSALAAKIELLDTSINKANIEISPLQINDTTLIYSSLKIDEDVLYSPDDKITSLPVSKFYRASLRKDWKHRGEWADIPVNEELFNTGNGAFNADRTRFYFTRCKKNWKSEKQCAIYVSRFDSVWLPAEALPDHINAKKTLVTQPAVGTESKYGKEVLYFVSNNPEGKGGLDIWYSVYDQKKDVYKSPKNAGKGINSPGDEITPFYDNKSHTLYFSSNGQPGMGGYDIFATMGELNKWIPFMNFGYPVNTEVDEMFFSFYKNRDKGFFVSNRKGGVAKRHETCCYDIYSYEINDFVNFYVKGIVYAKDTVLRNGVKVLENVPLADADVTLNLKYEEGSDETFLMGKTKSNKNGEYFFSIEQGHDYRILAGKREFLTQHADFSAKGNVEDTIRKNVAIKKITDQPIVIKNIYYDYDKATLTAESEIILDTTMLVLMKENEDLIVEISSHTDSKGSDTYNMKLSQKRAESVIKHLAEKGIDKKRMKPKGYGESKPIAPNENPDGTDNPDGRLKNRRTEFTIIGIVGENRELIYKE